MTRTSIAYLLAASIGIVGIGQGAFGADPGQNMRNAAQDLRNARDNLFRGGSQAAQDANQDANQATQNNPVDLQSRLSNAVDDVHKNAHVNEVQQRIAKLIDASLQGNNLQNVTNYLDKDSQDRLSNLRENDNLQDETSRLQQEFKSKYNEDLSFADDSAKLFQNSQSVEGKVTNPNALQQWPVRTGQNTSTSYSRSYNRSNDSSSSNNGVERGDHVALIELNSQTNNNQQGRNYGDQNNNYQDNQDGNGQYQNNNYNRSQNGQSSSPTIVSAVKQNGTWYIAVPQSLDGNQLQQNLRNQIRQVLNHKNQWPSDPDQARQIIATHILNAYTGNTTHANNYQQEAGNR